MIRTQGAVVPGLPYVDEHRITVDAPSEVVWAGLRRHVDRMLAANEGSLVTRLLGTDPSAGFEVAGEVPQRRLELTGRHRFSRYALVFELDPTLDPTGAQTVVRALTYARFPGLHGRIYRLLVISSRAHVVATNGLLRSIRRESLAQV